MRRVLTLLSLGLLSLLAAWPLLHYGPPLQANAITDGPNHLYRFALLVRHIGQGDFYPRWFSDLHYGFGAPVLNYYAPLSYYILAALHTVIPALPTVFQWGFILALSAAIVGMFLWAKDQFGSEAAGFAGAAAYAFTPYIYFSILERAAYPELWGLALAPWVFWSALRLSHVQSFGRRIAFVLLYAALILTHNLSALLFTPILLAYISVLIWPPSANRLKRLGVWAATLTQAVCLAAFFVLPFLVESSEVHFERTAQYAYAANFSSTADLFSLPVPFDPQHVAHPYPVSIPWPQLLLAALGLGLALFLPNSLEQRAISLVFAGFAALFIFLNLRLSLPVWDVMPLATSIQFPFRLLGPAMLLLAWLTAAFVAQISLSRQQVIALCVVAGTFFFNLTWTFHAPFDVFPDTLRPQDIIQDEIAHPERFGTTNLAEFVPRWVEEVPPTDTLLPRYDENSIPSRLAPLPNSVTLLDEATTLTSAKLTYDSDDPFTATYDIFYFPGWQATLDGAPLQPNTPGPNGLIQLNLPAGQHTVQLALQPTQAKIAGAIISLLALTALFIPLTRVINGPVTSSALPNDLKPPQLQKKPTASNPPLADAGRLRFVLVQFLTAAVNALTRLGIAMLALLVVLVALRVGVLERINNPFYRFGLQAISNQVSINFDNQLKLVGFDLPGGTTLQSGEELTVNLYWQASTSLSTDYHTSIQLVDSFGNRFGQSDSQHPAGVPTSRWQPAQYARDTHYLPSLAGTPPGDYHLVVSAYADNPLTVRDADNNPIGLEFDLGTVTVTRGPTQSAGPLRVLESSMAADTLSVGDPLLFTLLINGGDALTIDIYGQFTLHDQAGNLIYISTFTPAGPNYPSSQWIPNELIRYPHNLTLPSDLPAGPATAAVTFLNIAGRPVSETFELGQLTITVPERTFTVPPMAYPVDHDFDSAIWLLGYDLAPDGITLYWQAHQPIPVRLTVFIHVFDENGNFISGHDAPPLRSTTSWLRNEVITDFHPIPPGTHFEIGLYNPLTGERLGEPYLHSE